jgi:hypothetical protein
LLLDAIMQFVCGGDSLSLSPANSKTRLETQHKELKQFNQRRQSMYGLNLHDSIMMSSPCHS